MGPGFRVVTEKINGVRSIALGFWIGTGSRHESHDQAGVSHFLEHLLFKGTEHHDATEIAEAFDSIGADINAFTAKEQTVLHARFLDEHLPLAFEITAEMVCKPVYREIDVEREVILEEIAMYEDEPQDKVHDLFAGAVFGDHPLGRPVIGSADVISKTGSDTIASYHQSHYVPAKIVVAAAGNIGHGNLVQMVSGMPINNTGKGPQLSDSAAPNEIGPRAVFMQKETDQYHICLGGRGINRSDERRFALGILDSILGGSVSSRLFQEVREKRGLAYAIYSYAEQYFDCGYVGIYVGTRPENVGQVAGIIASELERLQNDPASEDELERAKENFKGRFVLAMESTQARMNRLGRSILGGVELLSMDEIIERIDAVGVTDLRAIANDFYRPDRLSASAIGTDEEIFQQALKQVNQELVAA